MLDEALSRGVHLHREHVRDALGLSKHHVDEVGRLVERLGGLVHRVSSLHDWMHISLPVNKESSYDEPRERMSPFVQRSLTPVAKDADLQRVLHLVNSALESAGLNNMVSHMMIVSDDRKYDDDDDDDDDDDVSKNRDVSTKHHFTGRSLQQQESDKNSNQVATHFLGTDLPQVMVDTMGEAVRNMGVWLNTPVFILQCQGKESSYVVGENTDNCFLGIDVLLQPMQGVPGTSSANPVTIRLENLTQFAKPCREVAFCSDSLDGSYTVTNETYLYGIPLYKYTVPNVLYSGSILFTVEGSEGIGLVRNDLDTLIYNYYNASAVTLRDLYGVDPSIQGSPETVQASMLSMGTEGSAVNTTAVNEYLGFLGLEPHSQLQIRDFGVPNNISICNGTDICMESMIDTQILQSFAPNATTYFTPSSRGRNAKEVAQLLLSFLDDALNAQPQTQVASLSWTHNYVDGADLPIQSLEGYLKKLAAVGMTILVSSGDAGASANRDGCYAPTGDGQLAGNYISQAWPTASPWVTSVGGTQLLALGEDLETEEIVCSASTNCGITSAGGFSGQWLNVSTPSWQEKFVSKYLKENNASTFGGFPTPRTPGYNPSGRGFPDIAAYAANIPILTSSGGLTAVSGTSLSTPMAASLFTMANQKLLQDGYRLLGYANPMLYWMADNCPEAFHDVTIGDNQSNEDGDLCQYGYPAAAGWDPVTGLGSIQFAPFVECVKAYQDLKS